MFNGCVSVADTPSFSDSLSLSPRIDLWACFRDERELRLVVPMVKVVGRGLMYIYAPAWSSAGRINRAGYSLRSII